MTQIDGKTIKFETDPIERFGKPSFQGRLNIRSCLKKNEGLNLLEC